MTPQKCRDIPVRRQFKLCAKQPEELASPAVYIAVALVAWKYRKEQRDEKTDEPKPCKEYIEKTKGKI